MYVCAVDSVEYSSSSLAPFDRLVRELTALMAQQATQVTAKMQGVLNNRDNEIMQVRPNTSHV